MKTKQNRNMRKRDLEGLLAMCSLLLGAMALRYAIFLPEFL